jgi:light-regulated signal transduction histidine kinase (bacteriophytochrome)
VRLNLIRTRSGPLVLSVIVDISERVKAREALEEQTRELQRSNDDLEQFAYVASHDLREPLRMVASYAELLAERYRGRLDQSADKYIDYTLEGARRMQQLITDLLAFSRIGTQSRPMQPTDVTVILERVIRNVHALIEDSGATIVAGDLPTVVADESQLTQVFQNLIGNAVKFRCEERPPRVEVAAERRNGLWAFRVADNGIGIAPHHAERVFQMFQRLHERGRYDGSGIGLAIAKKIIERHGGRLWLESAVGEGSTFYFTIPDPERRRSGLVQERAA